MKKTTVFYTPAQETGDKVGRTYYVVIKDIRQAIDRARLSEEETGALALFCAGNYGERILRVNGSRRIAEGAIERIRNILIERGYDFSRARLDDRGKLHIPFDSLKLLSSLLG